MNSKIMSCNYIPLFHSVNHVNIFNLKLSRHKRSKSNKKKFKGKEIWLKSKCWTKRKDILYKLSKKMLDSKDVQDFMQYKEIKSPFKISLKF